MPPRPASSSARAGSSQSQGSDEERAVTFLERLAGAADLGAFVGDDSCLHAVGADLFSSVRSAAAAAAGSPVHALLAAWMAAVARGMQLAAQQLDISRLRQHSKQVDLLYNLVGAISDWFRTLDRPQDVAAGPVDGKERMRIVLSLLAVRAGVVKVHKQLSLRLTSIISSPQAASSGAAAAARQQQQQMDPDIARLITEQFNLLKWMARGWPGGPGGLFSPTICQAVPAAGGLAAAVLSGRDVRIRCHGATGSTWTAVYDFNATLGNAYNTFEASGRSVPALVAGSSVMGTMPLMFVGLAADRLHHLQHGLSPAAVGAASSAAAAGTTRAQQPRLAVPAFHTQLLQALGVPASSAQPNSPLMAVQDVKLWGVALRSPLATPGKRQLLAAAAAAASCQLPLLLVLLECLLLDPAQDLLNCALAMLQRTLDHCEQTALQLGPPLLRAILEQDACRRALESAAAGVAQQGSYAHSVLQVVAPLVMTATKAVMIAATYYSTDIVACEEAAAYSHSMAGLAEVALEHTAQYASLLEAGLRMLRPETGLLPSAVAAARAVAAAAHTWLSAGSGVLAADSQQQVFALLVSCLKAATAVAAEEGNSSSSQGDTSADESAYMIRDFVSMVVRAAIEACSCLFCPSSPSSSNQPSMAAPAAAADTAAGLSAQLGCVLLARCLVETSKLLQQQAQAPAIGNTESSDIYTYLQNVAMLIKACCRGVAVLGQQLAQQAAAASAAEPWWQQLQDEHALLEQQLDSLQAQMAAASGEANPQPPAAALARVAEQLQAFGAAACAALPVQQCCNHHDCCNLEQASELELVSGKSCVCGGCRVARYCSRECQVAHYKGWHRPVCKRLQAQQRQQQQQGQAASQQQQ